MVMMRRYYYEGRVKWRAKSSEKECKETGIMSIESGWGGRERLVD